MLCLNEFERESPALGRQPHECGLLVVVLRVLRALFDRVGGGSHAAHRQESVILQEGLSGGRQQIVILTNRKTVDNRIQQGRESYEKLK